MVSFSDRSWVQDFRLAEMKRTEKKYKTDRKPITRNKKKTFCPKKLLNIMLDSLVLSVRLQKNYHENVKLNVGGISHVVHCIWARMVLSQLTSSRYVCRLLFHVLFTLSYPYSLFLFFSLSLSFSIFYSLYFSLCESLYFTLFKFSLSFLRLSLSFSPSFFRDSP